MRRRVIWGRKLTPPPPPLQSNYWEDGSRADDHWVQFTWELLTLLDELGSIRISFCLL